MLLEGAIGLLAGALGSAASAVALVRAFRAPVRELERKVADLEASCLAERLISLKGEIDADRRRLEKHIEGDQSQRIVTLLETMQGTIRQMGAKIDRLCEETASLRARTDATESLVRRVSN